MKRIIIITAAILIALPLSLTAQRKSSGRKVKERASVSQSRADRSVKAKRSVSSRRSKASARSVSKTSRSQSRNKAIKPSGTRRSVSGNRSTIHKKSRIKSSPQRSSGNRSQVRSTQHNRNRNSGYKAARRNQHVDRNQGHRRNKAINSHKDFRRRYYRSNYNRRLHGNTHAHINNFYRSRRVARNHYHVYHKPSFNIYFRPAWFRFYVDYFPDYHISYSRELHMIPGNMAYRYIGEVKMVYGKVYETYYDPHNREFFLYFGAPYPNQDFTVVITGRDAKRMERRQGRYYIGRDFSVAGLITSFDRSPEIVISDRDQLRRF